MLHQLYVPVQPEYRPWTRAQNPAKISQTSPEVELTLSSAPSTLAAPMSMAQALAESLHRA